MPLPDVSIARSNGNLGRVQPTADNVFLLVLSGTAVATKINLLEVKSLTSSTDITGTLGITNVNNSLAYQELLAFYANAKDGTKVYLMLYSDATPLADLCLYTNTTGGIRKALDLLDGEVSIVYINKKVPAGYTATITDGLDADVWAAATNLQTTLNNYQAANAPVVGTLPGLGFAKATAATLVSLKLRTNNMLSIVLGSDSSTGLTCMGRLAGWESLLQVHQNISRVISGAVLELAYFIDGTPVKDLTSLLGDMHDKGYIFFRKLKRKSGYYYNGDSTAVADSDDYSSRSWNRTINKAQRIAYDVLIMHLNDDVDTDPTTGGISPALAADWEGEVESAIRLLMISAKADANKQPKGKEINGEKCTIDLDQVVVANDQLAATLQIVRKGQAKNIVVSIGYATTI